MVSFEAAAAKALRWYQVLDDPVGFKSETRFLALVNGLFMERLVNHLYSETLSLSQIRRDPSAPPMLQYNRSNGCRVPDGVWPDWQGRWTRMIEIKMFGGEIASWVSNRLKKDGHKTRKQLADGGLMIPQNVVNSEKIYPYPEKPQYPLIIDKARALNALVLARQEFPGYPQLEVVNPKFVLFVPQDAYDAMMASVHLWQPRVVDAIYPVPMSSQQIKQVLHDRVCDPVFNQHATKLVQAKLGFPLTFPIRPQAL